VSYVQGKNAQEKAISDAQARFQKQKQLMDQQLQNYAQSGQQGMPQQPKQSFTPNQQFGYANFNPAYGRV
jgi:hypothetical protein